MTHWGLLNTNKNCFGINRELKFCSLAELVRKYLSDFPWGQEYLKGILRGNSAALLFNGKCKNYRNFNCRYNLYLRNS